MTSTLAWLDATDEEQRRMREIVAMFSQQESRDELGIGGIRDSFSNQLFPGVSVIQTRARYLLFVPWIFRQAERKKVSPAEVRPWGETRERSLIQALRRGGDLDGLIGRVAGVGVKILPSTIYWSGLETYGIVRHPGGIDIALRSAFIDAGEAEELAERHPTIWNRTLPEPPDGFFSFGEQTFALTAEEAEWLLERIASAVPDSLHGHLLIRRIEPSTDASAPWLDPAAADLPDHLQRVLEHARLFSLSINGAALLYNLLLARKTQQLGWAGADDRVEQYERLLAEWWNDVGGDPAVSTWSRSEFWATVLANPSGVIHRTRSLVDAWLDLVQSGAAADAAASRKARALVDRWERQVKGPKARLQNEALLAAWNGTAGTRRLTYRWETARTQLHDIFEGLRAGA